MVLGKFYQHKPPHEIDLPYGQSFADGTAAFNLHERAHLYSNLKRPQRDEMVMLIRRMRERMLQPTSKIPEVVQSLITWKNPDIQKICRYRNIPAITRDEAEDLLWRGVEEDVRSIVRIAHQLGARINVARAGRLPEQRAAEKGHVKVLEELRHAGISMYAVYGGPSNHTYHKGETLTHIAAKYDQRAVVDFLQASGAYMHKPDYMGVAPARYAQQAGNSGLAQRLDEAPVLNVTEVAPS